MDKEKGVNYSALWAWARSNPGQVFFLLRIDWRLWRASHRRSKQHRQIDDSIPSVVAISPTMQCNYDCTGCYSIDRRIEDELSTDELDALLIELESIVKIYCTGISFDHCDLLPAT